MDKMEVDRSGEQVSWVSICVCTKRDSWDHLDEVKNGHVLTYTIIYVMTKFM